MGSPGYDGLYFTELFELNRDTFLRAEPRNLLGPRPFSAHPDPDLAKVFRGLEESLPHCVKAGNQGELFVILSGDGCTSAAWKAIGKE